jgi:photosystem II stability/assembly factor-like uncharacterized protein
MKRSRTRIAAAICAAFVLPLLASASDTQHCYLRDASSPGASTAFLLCEQGLVYGTTDNGVTWVSHDTGATVTLHGISFFDGLRGVAVGDEGTLLATMDGGKTWQPRAAGTKEHLLSAFCLGDHAWVGGFDGTILYSPDSGQTWTKQKSGTTMALESIFFLDPDRGWAVGWSGTILRTADAGRNWEPIKTDAALWSLAAVRFIDQKNGFAVGFSGQLLRSRDGGATWAALKSPSQSWLTSVATDRAKRIWIAADDQLLVSEDGGDKWKAIPVDANYFVNRVFPVGDSLWALAALGILKQTGPGVQFKHDESFVPAGAHIANSLDDAVSNTATTGTGKSK